MRKHLLAAFLLLAVSGMPAWATNCVPFTYTLTNGQTADANQVMANFNTLLTCANTNLAHNGANSDITQLTGLTTPLTVPQGGTGLGTLTIHAVPIGNAASAPNFAAPSTAKFLLGDNGASADPTFQHADTTYLSDVTAPTSWTPTDQSGASLSFTSVSANYTKIGNMVYAYGTLTFPSTVSAAAVTISLPVAVPNQTYAAVPSTVTVTGSGPAFTVGARAVKNTSTFNLVNLSASGNAAQNNSSFSTATLTFLIIYPAS